MTNPIQDTLQDCLNIEGEAENEEQYRNSMQNMIDSGNCWMLQGSMGRAAMDAMESGLCILGPDTMKDYWGNNVPSRDQVVAGTKGSLEYARKLRPDLWETE